MLNSQFVVVLEQFVIGSRWTFKANALGGGVDAEPVN